MNSDHETLTPAHFRPDRPWWFNIAVLGALNVVFLVAIIILLGKLGSLSESVYKLNGEKIISDQKNDTQLAQNEIRNYKDDADQLFSLFPSENKILDIVVQLDQLKKDGTIVQYSFASDQPVKDKSGYQGIPILFNLKGSKDTLNVAFQKISSLHYILRDIKLEIKQVPDTGEYTAQYGVFLYVDENFGKN